MTTGIIFNGEMVRAILDGRKTQTRRVVRHQPIGIVGGPDFDGLFCDTKDPVARYFSCPHGKPGDRLWVRETFARFEQITVYRADCLNGNGVEDADSMRCRLDYKVKWRPSIFMPKWASRITLEIVSVRVERVQEISEDDVAAEGVTIGDALRTNGHKVYPTRIDAYETLWDSINAKRGFGWAKNPFVWVITFRRIFP